MSAQRLPPFSSLLKSREVEDPVNIWVHRPLAYAFVAAIFRTRITPNQVTLLAMVVGMVAGAMWLWGTATAMVVGGILLWTSAILDGADGILARAKKMQSPFGRALDGAADMVVAICTVIPAFWHCYRQAGDINVIYMAIPAIVLTVYHLYLYDYYKESYLRMTRLDRGGEGEDASATEKRLHQLESEGGRPLTRMVLKHLVLPMARTQNKLIRLTNPLAFRDGVKFTRTEETVRIYREHNVGPMRLWAFISLAPHTYIMSILGMADRLDIYIWVRLVLMNVVFVAVLLWQRRATERTMRELSNIGAAPAGVAPQAA